MNFLQCVSYDSFRLLDHSPFVDSFVHFDGNSFVESLDQA
jgi:hypothetical protein